MTDTIDGRQLALFDIDPPPPRRGPGRPPRDFTPDELLEVRTALRVGRPLWEIAARVGCTVPTLRSHFAGLREWQARRQKPKKGTRA